MRCAGEEGSRLRPQRGRREGDDVGQGWTVASTEPGVRDGGLWGQRDRLKVPGARWPGEGVPLVQSGGPCMGVRCVVLLSRDKCTLYTLGSHLRFLDWGLLCSVPPLPVQGGLADRGPDGDAGQ